jgi:hypothetical protein
MNQCRITLRLRKEKSPVPVNYSTKAFLFYALCDMNVNIYTLKITEMIFTALS